MKTLKYFIGTVAVTLLAVGCQTDSLETYSGVDNYYFSFANLSGSSSNIDPFRGQAVDSLEMGLLKDGTPVTDSIVELSVTITGLPVGRDRAITAEGITDARSTAVEGEDYEILESFVPADSIKGFLRIRVKNSQKLTDAGDEGLQLKVKLVANSDFSTNYIGLNDPRAAADKVFKMDALTYKIRFNNQTESSILWITTTGNAQRDMNNYFGPQSPEKIALLVQLTGLGTEWWYPAHEFIREQGEIIAFDNYSITPDKVTDAMAYQMYAGILIGLMPTQHYTNVRLLNKALAAYKLTHNGEPMRTASGEEITAGAGGAKYL